jgi:hypothetical protein
LYLRKKIKNTSLMGREESSHSRKIQGRTGVTTEDSQHQEICGDSKMVARGRKEKACLLQRNLGETLETHLIGKATEKRQNFDPSTPPGCTENLHFTFNGETRRAPGPPAPRRLGKMRKR